MTTRLLKEIYEYEAKALDSIPVDHPHYEEVKQLLIDQINDEVHDVASTYTSTN